MKHLKFRNSENSLRPLQPAPALETIDAPSLIEQLTQPAEIQLRARKSTSDELAIEGLLDASELQTAMEQVSEMLAIEAQARSYSQHGCAASAVQALKYRLMAIQQPAQAVALESAEDFTPQVALEGLFDGIKEWWNKRREEAQHRAAQQAASIQEARKIYSNLLQELREAATSVAKSAKLESDDVRLDNLTQYFCDKGGKWPTDLHGVLQKGLQRAVTEVEWLVADQEAVAKIVHQITRGVSLDNDAAFKASYIKPCEGLPAHWKTAHWKPNDVHHYFGPFMSEMEGKGCFYMKEKDVLIWMRAALEDKHNHVYFLSKLSDRTKAFEHHQTYSRQEALRLIELGVAAVEHVVHDGIDVWLKMCQEAGSVFNRDQYVLYGLQHGVDVITNKKLTVGLQEYDAYVKSADMQNPAVIHNKIFNMYLHAITTSERMARAVAHLGIRIAKQF